MKIFLIFIILSLSIVLISASTCPKGVSNCNPNLPFQNPVSTSPSINTSILNVNNSQYLQGYTPFNLPYCFANGTNSSGVNCQNINGVNYTYLNETYVPYSGAIKDVNIGWNYFKSDGGFSSDTDFLNLYSFISGSYTNLIFGGDGSNNYFKSFNANTDLGDGGNKWRDLWLSRDANIGGNLNVTGQTYLNDYLFMQPYAGLITNFIRPNWYANNNPDSSIFYIDMPGYDAGIEGNSEDAMRFSFETTNYTNQEYSFFPVSITGSGFADLGIDSNRFRNVYLSGNITGATNICYSDGSGCLSSGNSSFNQSLTDTLYYSINNPSNFYNLTNAPTYKNDTWAGNQSNYYNKSQIDNNLSLYYLNSNPNSYYNVTTLPASSTNLTNVALTNQSNNFNNNNLTNISFIQNVVQNVTGNLSVYDHFAVGVCEANSGSVFINRICGNSVVRTGFILENMGSQIPDYTGLFGAGIVDNYTRGFVGESSLGAGGLAFQGFTRSNAQTVNPLTFVGYLGNSTITSGNAAIVKFLARQSNGLTNQKAPASGILSFEFSTYTTNAMDIFANGDVNLTGSGNLNTNSGNITNTGNGNSFGSTTISANSSTAFTVNATSNYTLVVDTINGTKGTGRVGINIMNLTKWRAGDWIFTVGDGSGTGALDRPLFRVDSSGNVLALQNIGSYNGYGTFQNLIVGGVYGNSGLGNQNVGGGIDVQNSITTPFLIQTALKTEKGFLMNCRSNTTINPDLWTLQKNGVNVTKIDGNGTMTNNGTINTLTNFSVNNVQGITISSNKTVLKDVNLVSLVKTYCDINETFTGGILTSYVTTC